MSPPLVRAQVDARGVARVTIENAAKLNCLSSAAALDLVAAMRSVGAAPNLRVVVLTGAGDKAAPTWRNWAR
jgi:methylglutaconyl-CoA hydratase